MELFAPIESLLRQSFNSLPFEVATICTIDFKKGVFQTAEYYCGKKNVGPEYFYDLASISKPMTLATYALMKKFELSSDLELLIDHRAGLVFWGILGQNGWRDLINSYSIKNSPTVYSDFSALRAMLEIEKIEKKSLYACVDQFWHHELCHWKKLPEDARCHTTGFREGSDINGEVHDPNAYCLGVELSHAGLFATPKGLAQTLLNLNNKLGLLSEMHQLLTTHRKKFDRFVWGWDTPQGPDSTAGANAPNTVFGHLGFVGNSLWIDAAKQRGLILFTNQSRYAWYERTVLNQLRKQLYSSFWELS